ncbi:MAG: hypothetical protein Q8858_11760 [Bacteroidota bacterium]|nr:hypothetical protein [Bacteroidota bacterium]
MELKETKATSLLLQTPNEVRMMAIILQDFYEDDLMDDPDDSVFSAGELQDSLDAYMIDTVKDQLNKDYTNEFAQYQSFIYNLEETEPVVIKLTDEMKQQIDDILPEMWSDDDDSDEDDAF